MTNVILALNAGSSSIKFSLFASMRERRFPFSTGEGSKVWATNRICVPMGNLLGQLFDVLRRKQSHQISRNAIVGGDFLVTQLVISEPGIVGLLETSYSPLAFTFAFLFPSTRPRPSLSRLLLPDAQPRFARGAPPAVAASSYAARAQ
jgi:hypothetical protein